MQIFNTPSSQTVQNRPVPGRLYKSAWPIKSHGTGLVVGSQPSCYHKALLNRMGIYYIIGMLCLTDEQSSCEPQTSVSYF